MDIERMTQIVNEEISKAEFDRDKYRVNAIQHVNGNAVQLFVLMLHEHVDGKKYLQTAEIDCDSGHSEEQLRKFVPGWIEWNVSLLEDELEVLTPA